MKSVASYRLEYTKNDTSYLQLLSR